MRYQKVFSIYNRYLHKTIINSVRPFARIISIVKSNLNFSVIHFIKCEKLPRELILTERILQRASENKNSFIFILLA